MGALVKILEKAQLQAGLDHLGWQDFRRTYISDLINRYDLVTAQKIIGHSSTSITAKDIKSFLSGDWGEEILAYPLPFRSPTFFHYGAKDGLQCKPSQQPQ